MRGVHTIMISMVPARLHVIYFLLRFHFLSFEVMAVCEHAEQAAQPASGAACSSTSNGPVQTPDPETSADVFVDVPEGVRPGITKLQAGGILVTVPAQAVPGNRLRLRPAEDGQWTCVEILRTPASDITATTAREIAVTMPNVPPAGSGGPRQLRFDLGPSGVVVLPAPAEAKAGDTLKLRQDSATGQWSCHLAVAEQSDVVATPSSEQPTSIRCQIPEGATPGETALEMQVGPGGQRLSVLVPATARPGDVLELVQDEATGRWTAHIAEKRVKSMELELRLPAVAIDQDAACARLLEAARTAGAHVSRKLRRGSAPPLNIMGMIASERIDVGEELFVLPRGLLLSPENCSALMPEYYNGVHNLKEMPDFFKKDAGHATCLAILLRDAEDRLAQQAEDPSFTAPARTGPHAATLELWDRYAEALLGEPFQQHPYWKALESKDAVTDLMKPSREGEVIHNLAIEVLSMYSCVAERLAAVTGPNFEASLYIHAHLSILSRVFATGHGETALVPATDLCNHHPGAGTVWDWDADRDAHVVRAIREHQPGEEVKLSYGNIANVYLFRTYGFTLPPSEEPGWAFLIQEDLPQELIDKYLPANFEKAAMRLDTAAVQQSLVTAFNACADKGSDPAEFLREICEWGMSRYRGQLEEPLASAIEVLKRRRQSDPQSAAWWEDEAALQCLKEATALEPSFAPHWAEAALRVKMSEYLCLVAHIEVYDVYRGKLAPERSLGQAQALRETLLNCFSALKKGDRLELTMVSPDPA
eukprot:TRINITY_DN121001_c0_g1_i1.p1 TRINITY_DN121001_c0_g1~~TRINITY_DN121001_c0_g1_i1.p1  ORF type:complete len:763 (-),score=133.50 TRINITY_DN121001_c0_g1_i1:67-2355(-)